MVMNVENPEPVGWGSVEPKPRAEACFEHGEAEKGAARYPDAPPKKKPTIRWAFSFNNRL
jgi:hypothetical protein